MLEHAEAFDDALLPALEAVEELYNSHYFERIFHEDSQFLNVRVKCSDLRTAYKERTRQCSAETQSNNDE